MTEFRVLAWLRHLMLKVYKKTGLLATTLIFATQIAIADTGSWRVVTEILPPLQQDANGALAGPAVDKVKALLADTGIEAPIEVFPWARAYDLAQSRKNTLIFSMARYQSRESMFHWIGPIGQIQFSFVALADREEIQINSNEDAKKWVLGTVRNDAVHDWLNQHGFTEDEHFVIRSDLQELAELLYKGLIDGLLVNKEIIKIIAAQKGYDPNRIRAWHQPEGLSSNLYLAASINSDPDMVEKLKAAF